MNTYKLKEMIKNICKLSMLVIMFTMYGKLTFSQDIVDLVDLVACDNCISFTNSTNIMEWNVDNQSTFNPSNVLADGYLSLSIGYVQANLNTVLNTYICADYDTGLFKYWDGSEWIDYGVPYIENIQGIGSYENNLYIKSHKFAGREIHYYDGNTLELIQENSSAYIADIAVDDSGRGWYPSANIDGALDSLHVINNSGEIIEEFRLSQEFDGIGVYGMTIVNDTIYFGVGTLGSPYSNSLIAFVIEDGVAVLTQVIAQENSIQSYSDLASKFPGDPLNNFVSIAEEADNQKISIYPNPTNDFLYMDNLPQKNQVHFELFDLQGRSLLNQEINQTNRIDLQNVKNGMYMYVITFENEKQIGKIIKK